MPLSMLTGLKLRERRLAAGLRQADVAVRAGISASYLNLIEHNRRKVTPDVLERLAIFAGNAAHAIAEIEINPLFVGAEESCAVDVLMQVETRG